MLSLTTGLLRAIPPDAQPFSPSNQVLNDDDSFTATSAYPSVRGSRSKRVAPNRAAEACFQTVRELFRYALLVPQHTDQVCIAGLQVVARAFDKNAIRSLQVVLILQRTVEEFITAVRNRRREHVGRLVSQEACSKIQASGALGDILNHDPYFRRYCKRVYGRLWGKCVGRGARMVVAEPFAVADGRPSPLELLGLSSQIRAAAQEMMPAHTDHSDDEEEDVHVVTNHRSLQTHSGPSLKATLAAKRPYLPVRSDPHDKPALPAEPPFEIR